MISVVIPARNAEHSIRPTLEALRGVEVIVSDNGSSDATAAVARSLGAKVVSDQRPRRAAARNRGVAAAAGNLLLFTDAGCVPGPDWPERLAACLERTPLAGGAVHVTTTQPPRAVERFDALWRFKQEHAVRHGGWSAGANLGMTRDAFDRVGGFDESYPAGDDVDICLRARAAGLELGWCPEAAVAHAASRGIAELVRRALRQGASGTRIHRRLDGAAGRHHWRHPGGIVRGRAALRALGVDVEALEPAELRRMAMLARLDYTARFAGSAWAGLTRAGS